MCQATCRVESRELIQIYYFKVLISQFQNQNPQNLQDSSSKEKYSSWVLVKVIVKVINHEND